jgi:hypothetical protein
VHSPPWTLHTRPPAWRNTPWWDRRRPSHNFYFDVAGAIAPAPSTPTSELRVRPCTIEEAAKNIGVGANTLLRWMKEPEFQTAESRFEIDADIHT